ncbi:MAG: hypothetical protein K2I81_02625 [Alphaproteobacteria bacterium]|nr:hypothetical protein [Alphaproteobacteria bacterium]
MKFKDEVDFRLKAQACGQMLATLSLAGVMCLAYACGWLSVDKKEKTTDKVVQEKIKNAADSVSAPQKHTMPSAFQKVR